MSFKELSDTERNALIRLMSKLSPDKLEALYRDDLQKSVLPRASSSQRKVLYNAFKREYETKSERSDYRMKKTVLDKRDWMHPRKKATKTTDLEEQYVKNVIKTAKDPDRLRRFYKHVKNNVFPRAVGYSYSGGAPAFKENVEKMYHGKLSQMEKNRRTSRRIEKRKQKTREMEKPDIGTEVSMDGHRGEVIDRAYTKPEVRIQWPDGTTSWEKIEYLKW